ncbi:flagellar basal body rod protein FlgB [Vampirovibrio chlorellavorus]|uniref:flagellar basal body rod protein FlgB n=1 Tax=Vampirovibrio chlorellavorus TaxID=758823 RepID=UPI0026EFC9BC|nr:flagellar basal body protein [Vampirovibrio chlorellavorus]
MDFLDNALGPSLQYLNAISSRQKLTSANIANAHTPGYTARSASFAEVLKAENPFETNLSQRMGSKLSEMNHNTGTPVNLQKELVDMQKNLLFYSMTTRRAASIVTVLKSASQVGR